MLSSNFPSFRSGSPSWNIPQIPLLAEFNTSYIIAAHKQANKRKLVPVPEKWEPSLLPLCYQLYFDIRIRYGYITASLAQRKREKRGLDRARLLRLNGYSALQIAPGYDLEDMAVAVIQITWARVRHIGQSLNNRLDQRGQKVGF